MEKIKIIALQGLLFFITTTQLSAAQRELLDAGSSRRLDDASIFSDDVKKDDGRSLNALNKKPAPRYLEEGTQTDPEKLGDRALVLLKDAGKSLRSKCHVDSIQDLATAALAASLGLRKLGNFAIKGTKLEDLLILTGVLEVAVASYAITREGSQRYKELLPVSVICGLSTCAAFFERKDFTQPYWGKVFGLFTIGSNVGLIMYKALQELKKPSTPTNTTLALRDSRR